ncbi:hypothetical protein AAGS61_08875 [Lysinibacillus sp. KU-BSD001]|uniref:hypothetical protein n=1 Tax=Lysinibacillus sp. KU-BSD001 TaxID=3141328 RepID=UPI0036F14565
MSTWLSFTIVIVTAVVNYIRYREAFNELTKKEWTQYIGSFFLAWIVAIIIIIGGKEILNPLPLTGSFEKAIEWMLIIVGLMLALRIMYSMMPKKLKDAFE